MKRQSKRNYFGYISTILALIMIFIVIPQIMLVKSNRLMKKELEIKSDTPPTSDFYVAKNYLDIVAYFPGFSKKATKVLDNAISVIKGKYILASNSQKDSVIDILTHQARAKRDSILSKTKAEDYNMVSLHFDSIEDTINKSQWIEQYNNKEVFCKKWKLFFDRTSIEPTDLSTICK